MSYHVAIAIQYISQAAGIRRSNPRLGNGNYEIGSSPHTAASSSLGEECVISQYLRRDRMEQLSEEGERERAEFRVLLVVSGIAVYVTADSGYMYNSL